MKVMYKGVLFIGFFLLGHAAYSAGQCKLKVTSVFIIILFNAHSISWNCLLCRSFFSTISRRGVHHTAK